MLILIRQMACCDRTHTPELGACFQTVCHTMAQLDVHSLSMVADQLVRGKFSVAVLVPASAQIIMSALFSSYLSPMLFCP